MININSIVAMNLKKIREERHMSLDMLSKVSGVSKSMLGQIERGEVNPTISTVWKIASGLKISFTELIESRESEVEIVKCSDLTPLTGDEGRYRNYPLFPFDSSRRFEIYYIELDPESCLEAEPHPEGVQEFVTVFDGSLTVMTGEEMISLARGEAARFRADRPHTYCNPSAEVSRVNMVIYYPQQGGRGGEL